MRCKEQLLAFYRVVDLPVPPDMGSVDAPQLVGTSYNTVWPGTALKCQDSVSDLSPPEILNP